MHSITPKELVTLLDSNSESIELIDVRNTWEYDSGHIAEAKNIPLHIIPLRAHEIDHKKKLIFICQSGGRSAHACMFFMQNNKEAYNLVGWMSAFAAEFPTRVV